MAFCPLCHKEMGQTAVVCPHCGLDFPKAKPPVKKGLAYSGLATMALIVGQLISALACIGALVGTVVALVNNDMLQGVLIGPLSALFMLAILVLFSRALDKQ